MLWYWMLHIYEIVSLGRNDRNRVCLMLQYPGDDLWIDYGGEG